MFTSEDSPNQTLNPLAWLAAAFACGIVVGEVAGPSGVAMVAGAVVFGAIAAILRRREYAGLLVLAAFVCLGAFCIVSEREGISEDRLKVLYDTGVLLSGEPLELEGTVAGGPEPAPDGVFLTVRSAKVVVKGETRRATGTVRLYLPLTNEDAKADLDALELRHGIGVSVAVSPVREERFLNPGVMRRTQILDQQGIDATGSVKSPLLIERTGNNARAFPMGVVYEQRRRLIIAFKETFSAGTAGVLIASTLGDKYFLDKRTADLFREGGTFHILVISGLHITFIGGLAFVFVRLFTRDRRVQFASATVLLWVYALAVGGDPPAVRASIMFTIVAFAYVMYRNAGGVNALGACGLLLLVVRPSELFNPSFQLTFISVTGIIAMALPLADKLRAIGDWTPSAATPFPPRVPRWLRRFCETIYWREDAWRVELGRQVWTARLHKSPFTGRLEKLGLRRVAVAMLEGVLISAVVQIWMLPLLIYYFHRVSFSAIVLNLWVGTLTAIKSIIAFGAVAVAGISEIAAVPLIELVEGLNQLLLQLPTALLSLELASVRVPIYTGAMGWVYFVYFLPLVMLARMLARWRPFSTRLDRASVRWTMLGAAISGVLVVLMAGVMILHPYSEPGATGGLRVDFLDVGQGDAALITFPNGETMLIDGGGRVNYRRSGDEDSDEEFEPDVARIGEAVVSEFLWERGYSRVNYLMASHAHSDHIQGLIDAARNFKSEALYMAAVHGESEETTAIIAELKRKGGVPTYLESGDVLEIGGVKIEVLYPSDSEGSLDLSVNDRSLAVRLTFGSRRILFTGDIEAVAEQAILEGGTDLSADVVKVPHHGSRTSSSEGFIKAVGANTAVIPVGRTSRFGHPHPEVVERWKAAGAEVMTTGERGMITVITDGRDLRVERFLDQ